MIRVMTNPTAFNYCWVDEATRFNLQDWVVTMPAQTANQTIIYQANHVHDHVHDSLAYSSATTYNPVISWANYNAIYRCQQQQATIVSTWVNAGVWDYETPEQKIERKGRQVAEQQRAAAAETKAEELLLMCLTPQQRSQYLSDGYIELNIDTRKYRIEKGYSRNITRIREDGKKIFYCIQPGESVPVADCMLAQKLMLEADEREFLKTANHWKMEGGLYVLEPYQEAVQ